MTTQEPAPAADLAQTANRQLLQQRANGRGLPPERPARSIGEMLESLKSPAVPVDEADPDVYLSAATMQAFRDDPALMTDELHARECQSSFVYYRDELGQVESDRCPRCDAKLAEQRLRIYLRESGIDGRYLDLTWEDLDVLPPLDRVQAACGRIRQIIEAGASLLLWSDSTGSGKTQGAMLVATAAVRATQTTHVCNLARLAVEVRSGYGSRDGKALTEQQVLRQLGEAKLLVLDDLGAGETDNASLERRLLFLALDERQMRRLPTVVTTNLNPKQLVDIFGTRILARLQPLTILHVNHGINFRTRDQQDGLW